MSTPPYKYCPTCGRNTRHEWHETESVGMRIISRLVSLGTLSGSVKEGYCTSCGYHNFTYEADFDRYTWARKGTGQSVDRGAYPGYTA